MGSKRKKQEKKKDFQKAKLKVGKTQRKPDNYTDTSFTAKAISLPNQSIQKKTAPTASVDLTHQLSLAKHHSSQTRKEVLQYIETHLPSNPSVYKQIVSSTISLITDQSNGVRMALVALLKACAEKQVGLLDLHMRTVVLFLHSAMSHIQPDIRASSTYLLDVLVDYAPQSLVKGYFVKTLRCFFTLMSWNLTGDKKAVSLAVNANGQLGSGKKTRSHHLQVLQKFLNAALNPPPRESSSLLIDWSKVVLPHPQAYKYLIPQVPQPFASLRLFVDDLPSSIVEEEGETAHGAYSLADLDVMSSDDMQVRRKMTYDVFLQPMLSNLDSIIKEGGEPGKEAKGCVDFLSAFASDYSSPSK